MRHFINGSIERIQCNCSKCRSARDHNIEENVDRLQNKEKTIDEVAANEEIIKDKEEQIKKIKEKERESLMALSAEEREDLLDELREELKSLQAEAKDAKSNYAIANTLETVGVNNDDIRITKRHVLTLDNTNTIEKREGDKLLKLMGSQ